jgi:hypothetical protein
MYEVVNLNACRLPYLIPGSIIKFVDYSYKDQQPTTSSGVALPDPEFLAIHASIANILHKSGAILFIDYMAGMSNRFPDLRVLGKDEYQDLDNLALVFSVLDLFTV